MQVSVALMLQPSVCPVLALQLHMQMAGCVCLFMLLVEGTLWEKLLYTVGIDGGEIRALGGLG